MVLDQQTRGRKNNKNLLSSAILSFFFDSFALEANQTNHRVWEVQFVLRNRLVLTSRGFIITSGDLESKTRLEGRDCLLF